MNKKAKFKAQSGYVSREIAGEMLLIPVGATTQKFNGMIYFNETSMFIWEQITEPKTIDELVEAFRAEFDVDESEVRGDIEEFLSQALKQNIVEEI